MTTVLKCKDLSKAYRADSPSSIMPVFQNVSFSLEKGEGLYVSGNNGSGKTTLMSILAGLVDLSYGEIFLQDEQLSSINHRLRRKIGFSPATENSLFLAISVRKNLMFWLRLQGISGEVKKIIEKTASAWGFTKYLDRPARELSSGFRRRVILARAFLHEPCLVLLDEPFAFLDNENQERACDAIEEWLKKKTGAIVVSSNVEFRRGQTWKSLNLGSTSSQDFEPLILPH